MTHSDYLKEVGARMRAVRKSKNVTLTGLDRLISIDRSNLSEIERGKKNFHILTMKLVADALGVDLKEIL